MILDAEIASWFAKQSIIINIVKKRRGKYILYSPLLFNSTLSLLWNHPWHLQADRFLQDQAPWTDCS